MARLVQIELNPPVRVLRQFGFIALFVFGLLGFAAHRELFMFSAGLGSYRQAVTLGLAAVGALSALFSLVAPRANRVLFVTLSVVAFPIGWVISHVLLALLFYGMLAPMAGVMRLVGRDALRRRSASTEGSYWQKRPRARPSRDYFRQF